MFDFAPVGGITAIAGLLFVALLGWRLIPAQTEKSSGSTLDSYTDYIAELTVPENSKHIGKRLSELYESAEQNDVAILGLIRDGKRLYGTAKNIDLRAQDVIVMEAAPEALAKICCQLRLTGSPKSKSLQPKRRASPAKPPLRSDWHGVNVPC